MRTTQKFLVLAGVLITTVLCASSAEARRYTQVVNGREVVVHTNPLPVVLHRMVPPQHGRHVTEREVRTGNVPAPGPVLFRRGR